MPEAVKPLPAQESVLFELQVSVEDCPAAIEVGLAVRVALGDAGGEEEPTGHGVNDPLPQHTLKELPSTGADGFEVSP